MTLPVDVRETLLEVGQVAAEVPCYFEGYREFVSVYASPRIEIMAFEGNFPYFDGVEVLFRVIRFRVRSDLIENDIDVAQEDLAGLQDITLPSEDAVEFIMNIWKVPLGSLLSPRMVEIPV